MEQRILVCHCGAKFRIPASAIGKRTKCPKCHSQIVIGEYYVDWLYPDVIAAILAHEATHIHRAVDGTACYYANACTVLSNGVDLEEEVVAHEAEAEWWIAAYGRDGKDRAFTADASENRLTAAYLRGPAAFREFVRDMRSDKREGEGI